MAAPAALTETQAIQQLIAAKGTAGTKAAAAAGLDWDAIREVINAKAAAAKVGAAGAKGAMMGGVPVGVEPDVFRQAVAAQAGGTKASVATVGAKTGATAAKVGMVGVEPDIIREAIVSKAIGGAGAGTIAAGKGTGAVLAGGSTAAEAVTTGTIWSGKGLSLGLGIGLGVWGPVIVVAAGAAAVYAYLQYRQGLAGSSDEEIAEESADEGFYPSKA